jgi:hypothetical protein
MYLHSVRIQLWNGQVLVKIGFQTFSKHADRHWTHNIYYLFRPDGMGCFIYRAV